MILIIMAIAKASDIKKVFRTRMMINKKDIPLMLFIHFLKIFPLIINGIKLNNRINNGINSVNNKAQIVYTIESNNFERGSNSCKNESSLMNLKALRKSNPIFKFPPKYYFFYLLNTLLETQAFDF